LRVRHEKLPQRMITQLTVGNFRSLGRRVTVDLDPFTVLVGVNGAGKSNVADVLRFVGDGVRDGLEHAVASRQGFDSLRRWSRGRPFDVTLVLQTRLGDVDWSWGICLTGDPANEFRVKWEAATAQKASLGGEWLGFVDWDADPPKLDQARWGAHQREHRARLGSYFVDQGAWTYLPFPDLKLTPPPRALVLTEVAKLDPRFQPLVDHLAGLMVYSLFPPTLRLPQTSDPARPMRRQGENWATHLRALDPDTQGAELLAGLGRVVGDIDDYRVSAVGGYLIPEFRHGSDSGRERWLGAAQESDGTLRVAGLLTALLQSPGPTLVGIEEPELAVHPGALPLLVDFMKQAAAETQVIVTSHSPDLLDLVDPANLRVVDRGADGTTVAPLSRAQLDAVKSRLCSTSALLRAEGLQGNDGA
jgi:predicted ATPase